MIKDEYKNEYEAKLREIEKTLKYDYDQKLFSMKENTENIKKEREGYKNMT